MTGVKRDVTANIVVSGHDLAIACAESETATASHSENALHSAIDSNPEVKASNTVANVKSAN